MVSFTNDELILLRLAAQGPIKTLSLTEVASGAVLRSLYQLVQRGYLSVDPDVGCTLTDSGKFAVKVIG